MSGGENFAPSPSLADISKRFPTEDKGELEWILNTAITRDRGARTLNLSQGLYAADLVTKSSAYFDRSRSRRFDSPMEEGLELSADDQPAVGSVEHDEMSEFRTAYHGHRRRTTVACQHDARRHCLFSVSACSLHDQPWPVAF